MRTMIYAAATLGLMVLALLAAVYFAQRRLIYFPDTALYWPHEAGLNNVWAVTTKGGDGSEFITWHSPAAPGRPTLLYFHGNGGGLINRAERIRMFAKAGFGVHMMSYRGYSGGKGSPSEAANIHDALSAYGQLVRDVNVKPSDIVVYGESIGTGVAVQIAAEREVGAVVLEAPYTSLADIGKAVYPFLPVELLLRDRYDSKAHIAKIRAPLLIMHGTHDNVIPPNFGRALFDAAPNPKTLTLIANAGHSDIYAFGAFPVLERFIETHVGASTGTAGDRR